MLKDQPKYIYNIALPTSTVNEVIEWFEIMEADGKLANSLVELVYEIIKVRKPLENPIYSFSSPNESTEPQSQISPMINQSDFFDSLYDWQESSSATFKDEQEERKEKKKMLYV